MDCGFQTFQIKINGERREITRPWIMGILNVTPDSFYSGSRMDTDEKNIEKRVEQILQEDGDVIDIGAYSTRQNADEISVEEYGVDIINDVSGGTLDEGMFDAVAQLKVPYILMHMRGTPATMQSLTDYNDVTSDVIDYLRGKMAMLREKGVEDIVIDPGFGFSKTVSQNFEMMKRLREFTALDAPLLVGISRKSMIFRTLGCTPVESLNGTTALNVISLMNGAQILRTHDVKEAVEATKLVCATNNWSY